MHQLLLPLSWVFGVGVRFVEEIVVEVVGMMDVDIKMFVEGVLWTIGVFWCASCFCAGSSSSSVSSLIGGCLGVLKLTEGKDCLEV